MTTTLYWHVTSKTKCKLGVAFKTPTIVMLSTTTKKYQKKVDGVGLVDNRPSTDTLHPFVKKNMLIATHDMWHVTCDTWHVTLWHVTHLGSLPFSPNFSSLALTVWELCYFEYISTKYHWMNDWINKLQGCL